LLQAKPLVVKNEAQIKVVCPSARSHLAIALLVHLLQLASFKLHTTFSCRRRSRSTSYATITVIDIDIIIIINA